MTDPYNGKCPLCSGQLIWRQGVNLLAEPPVEVITLLCENDDYEVPAAEFEAIWDEYGKSLPDAAGDLLATLTNANLKKVL